MRRPQHAAAATTADVFAKASQFNPREAFDGVEHIKTSLNRTRPGRYHRRPIKYPWRTITAAVALLLTGTIMGCIGLKEFYDGNREKGVTELIISGITFLPGSYATFMLYGAWSRWPGYDWDSLPSYDDD